jgi:hypothetical protein
LLEPVLARVEREWLAELDRNATQQERRAAAAVRRQVRAGGDRGHLRLSATTRPEQEIRLYRDIAAGRLPVGDAEGRTMRAALRVSGGGYARGGTYVNDPANMGRSFITGAGAYESTIPAHVQAVENDVVRRRIRDLRAAAGLPGEGPLTEAQDRVVSGTIGQETMAGLSDTRRRLVERLEPARSEGMFVTRRVAEGLVGAGAAGAGEVTHGELNPMAFVGAAGEAMNEPVNRNERHRRLGMVMARLRAAAASSTITVGAGGAAVQRLGDAVERWLRANQQGVTRNADAARLDAATRSLVNAFLAFLRQQGS